MKYKRPDVMICPVCNHYFVHRRKKKCSQCGIALYYPGEYMWDRSGYMYHQERGWVKVEELVNEALKKDAGDI